jgi:AraC-like DNA-binding protein
MKSSHLDARPPAPNAGLINEPAEQKSIHEQYTKIRIRKFLIESGSNPVDVIYAMLKRGTHENISIARGIAGNNEDAAALLGMSSRSFQRQISELGLNFKSKTKTF